MCVGVNVCVCVCVCVKVSMKVCVLGYKCCKIVIVLRTCIYYKVYAAFVIIV